MAQETSPAFQLYVKEWRSSRNVMRMSFAERGMYLEMLLEQWESMSLPDSPSSIADIIGGKVGDWTKAWPTLMRCFVSLGDGRIVNLRLEKERDKQHGNKRRQSDRGKAGAESRWHKHASSMAQASPSIASDMLKHDPKMLSDGFPIPIAFPIATADTQASAATPKRGTQHGRIFVHPWQLNQLIDTLGPHASNFGLDEWVFGLSALADSKGLVLEKKEVWGWVQQQLSEEVRRRNLPVAGSAPSLDASLEQMRAEIERQNAAVRRA